MSRYPLPNMRALALAAVAGLQTYAVAYADDEPAATPYRPSVSSPANLSAPGWLDVEFGWQQTRGGADKNRDSFPVTAKLAFNPDWGVIVGTELGVRRTDVDGLVYKGSGDTVVQLKHRFATADDHQAWGMAAGFKAPTAKSTLGSGKTDYIVTGIYSLDFSDNHLDANLIATHLGAITPDQSRLQYAWAAAVSHNFNDQWGVLGELSGTYQRGAATTAQLLAGVTYNVSKQLVLDCGAAQGLTAAAPDWQAFAGMTVLLARVW